MSVINKYKYLTLIHQATERIDSGKSSEIETALTDSLIQLLEYTNELEARNQSPLIQTTDRN